MPGEGGSSPEENIGIDRHESPPLNIPDEIRQRAALAQNPDPEHPTKIHLVDVPPEARSVMLEAIAKANIDNQKRNIPDEVAPSAEIGYVSKTVRPPTPRELEELDEAITTKVFRGYKVVEVFDYGRGKAIKIEFENGKFSTFRPGEGLLGVYTLGEQADLEAVDSDTPEKAKDWLEKYLRPYERNPSIDIKGDFEGSLIATIDQKIPDMGVNPVTMVPYKTELRIFAGARIHYHNTSLKARLAIGDFAGDLMNIQSEEHQSILNEPGVKEALKAMLANEGRYFRIRNITGGAQEYTEARKALIDSLSIPGLPGHTGDQARLAVELAEKFSHITGEAGYYDGIRVGTGTTFTIDVPGGGGGVITPTSPDGFVSKEFLALLYPDPTLDLHDRYAKFFEEHWDDINFMVNPATGEGGSLSGGLGSLGMRGTFYLPVALEKPTAPNRGKPDFLRRYTYLRVSSLANFKTAAIPETSSTYQMDNFDTIINKIYVWAPRVAAAGKNKVVFADAGNKSILNVPLINPDNVTTGNANKSLQPALANYFEALKAYEGLPDEERKKAAAQLLKGLLKFESSDEAWKKFGYLKWNDSIKQDALILNRNLGVIDQELVREIAKGANISSTRAALFASLLEFTGGLWDGTKFIWSLVRGIR